MHLRSRLVGFAMAVGIAATEVCFGGVDPKLPVYRAPSGAVPGPLRSGWGGAANELTIAWLEGLQALLPSLESSVEGRKGPASQMAPGEAVARGALDFEPRIAELSPVEVDGFVRFAKHPPTHVRVALDALVVFVHPTNPVASLTLPQLDAVFSSTRKRGAPSAVTTWGQVGLSGEWLDRPVAPFESDGPTGARGFFRDHVLSRGDFNGVVAERKGLESLLDSVKSVPGGIGYAHAGGDLAGVRVVPIVGEDGKPYEPTHANVQSGKYPISRSILFLVNRPPKKPLGAAVREFLRFILSKQGQTIAQQSGYVPLSAPLATKERAKIE
jgi:phosphate transport system substrate-binding protein